MIKTARSIARNFISGITEDSSGQVWVSNENGIERYNRTDNSFTHFGVDRPGGTKELYLLPAPGVCFFI